LSASQLPAAASDDRASNSGDCARKEHCTLKTSATEFRASRVRSLFLFFAAWAGMSLGSRVASAELIRLKINTDQSTVSAAVAEPAAWIRGSAVGMFRIIDGEVSGDLANIQSTGKVRIIIDATSYRSDSAARDRSVTGSSLESDKFPTIGFESNSVVGVVMIRANEGTAIVNGFLTLHGETHPMTVPVHATLGADGTFVGDGEVKFKYEEFGVKVPEVLFGAILAGDEATVRFHIVAAKAAAPAPGKP
jgi:polyisoprenoid-binding protein YceI